MHNTVVFPCHATAIPTVSALPHHWPDFTRAASWLVQRLERAGLVSSICERCAPQLQIAVTSL